MRSAVLPLKSAHAIADLRVLPGEVYPDPVRVVFNGGNNNNNNNSHSSDCSSSDSSGSVSCSVELCGGTHITNTSEAQCFIILGNHFIIMDAL